MIKKTHKKIQTKKVEQMKYIVPKLTVDRLPQLQVATDY